MRLFGGPGARCAVPRSLSASPASVEVTKPRQAQLVRPPWYFRFSFALPRGPPPHAALTRGPTICLGRGDDACVLGAVERAGNALYGARVYVELGRRLAHAHAARQSRLDSLSQLIRDRRPAKALTFTLGPP